MDRAVQIRWHSFFFLWCEVKIGLCTNVSKNHYKYVFLLEMTKSKGVLFKYVRKWEIDVEFTWWRFIQLDQIVHFEFQNCIIAG